jgi:hypothetical protein
MTLDIALQQSALIDITRERSRMNRSIVAPFSFTPFQLPADSVRWRDEERTGRLVRHDPDLRNDARTMRQRIGSALIRVGHWLDGRKPDADAARA